jgi:GNAT superfamily N-acetyltransferase
MTITVRAAQPLDRVEILELFDAGLRMQEFAPYIYRRGTREEFEANLDAGDVFVAVAEEPIGVLGMLCLAGMDDLQTIGTIIVRADARGMGVGGALVEAAKIEACVRGGKSLMVIDRTERRDSALYRGAGFKPIGELMEIAL